MTTTNHTSPSGEDAANGAIGEREAWDGDSKESRTAFRAYDSIVEPVSVKTPWQIWRDACAWQASRAASMQSTATRTYTTKAGEAVAGIALRQCGNEAEWRHILACNPKFAHLLPSDYLPVGTVLTLPPIATTQPAQTQTQAAEDRRHVGSSKFEGWYADYLATAPVHQSPKQRARDAYAAGMADATPQPAQTQVAAPRTVLQERAQLEREWATLRQLQAQTQVALTDDARECLADVVSHYRALYAGLAFQLNEATVTENADDMAYWKHEIKALERMYAQAERALLAAQPVSGGKS